MRQNFMTIYNLRQFISLLQQHKEIITIEAEVDPYLELAEIHRRVIAANGPALFFNNIKGSSFPVVTNLFGSKNRIDLAFGKMPESFIRNLVKLPEDLLPPSISSLWSKRHFLSGCLKIGLKSNSRAPILANKMAECDLTRLPALTSWPEDGGPFLTLPLVHTQGYGKKPDNLGMYRIQIYSANQTGLHFQIGKGGGFHYYNAEQAGKALPVNIYLGGPPALILSAIAPLPENVPELLLASLVMGKKLKTAKLNDHPISPIAESEFCLVGEALPHVRREEGPFGDHYGYYSLKHEFPVFNVKSIYHRNQPIFPATVVGKPKQEDFYLGDYLQELLSPLFPLVMPSVSDLWSYGETGYHCLSAAVLKDRYTREGLASAFRILGEGQLSLTKFLIGIDKPLDLRDFKKVLTYVLQRVRWDRDLYLIANTAMDTLDYSGPSLNKGSKGILLGFGEPIRALPSEWRHASDQIILKAKSYCPGCLVIETSSYQNNKDIVKNLGSHPKLADWQLVVVVDNLEQAIKTDTSFLWTTFTRFDPAADIYSKSANIVANHIAYESPMVIDARMKPWYPKELFADDKTQELVTKRWKEYFPAHDIKMGSSDFGHLYA